MPSHEFLRNLSQKAAHLFEEAGTAHKDMEQKLYELMKTQFDRLNLVTREEFDAQVEVLERANRTIARLEQKIAELEAEVNAREGNED